MARVRWLALAWLASAWLAAVAGEALPYPVPTDIPLIDPGAVRADPAGDEERRVRIVERLRSLVGDLRAATVRSDRVTPPARFMNDVADVLAAAEQLADQPPKDALEYRRIMGGLESFANHLSRLVNLLGDWSRRGPDAAALAGSALWSGYEAWIRNGVEAEQSRLTASIQGRPLPGLNTLRRDERADAVWRLRVQVAAWRERVTTPLEGNAFRALLPEPDVFAEWAGRFEAGAAAEMSMVAKGEELPGGGTALARPGAVDALRIWRRYFETARRLAESGALPETGKSVLITTPLTLKAIHELDAAASGAGNAGPARKPSASGSGISPPELEEAAPGNRKLQGMLFSEPPKAGTASGGARGATATTAAAVRPKADDAVDPLTEWRLAVRAAAEYAGGMPGGDGVSARLDRLEAVALRWEARVLEQAKTLTFMQDIEDLRERLDQAMASGGNWNAFTPAARARQRLDGWAKLMARPGDPYLAPMAEGERRLATLLVEAVEVEAEWRKRHAELTASSTGAAREDAELAAKALAWLRPYAAERLEKDLRRAELENAVDLAAAQRRRYEAESDQWEAEQEVRLEERLGTLLGGERRERLSWLAP